MQSRTNYCPVIFKENEEKNKKKHLSLWETRGLIDFLLIIIIIWTIMIVVTVIIIAVVIIILVNVKEMYTSHGLFWFYCREIAVIFHSFPLIFPLFPSLSLSLSPVPSCLFSCLSLLLILPSMCHCWYIANYFFIGERYKARQNKKRIQK